MRNEGPSDRLIQRPLPFYAQDVDEEDEQPEEPPEDERRLLAEESRMEGEREKDR